MSGPAKIDALLLETAARDAYRRSPEARERHAAAQPQPEDAQAQHRKLLEATHAGMGPRNLIGGKRGA